MNWLLKAAAHWTVSVIPMGDEARFFLQKRIGRLPVPDMVLDEIIENALLHFDALTKVAPRDDRARYFEFGAGWDLIQPLVLWAKGFRRQHLVDINSLARVKLINNAIARLKARGFDTPSPICEIGDLTKIGIDYRAPILVSRTSLPDCSIKYIANTNVLEHVPCPDVPVILRECYRILADDGAMSIRIDCSDHYSHSDRNLTPVNFLNYSDFAWKFFNPPTHYQNRLRHGDYLTMASEAGFDIVFEAALDHGMAFGPLTSWITARKRIQSS